MKGNTGAFTTTIAPQVVGIYQEINLDPVSTRTFAFNVSFDADYSTVCIADIACETSAKTDSGFTAFKSAMDADLAAQTFYEKDVAWPYEATLVYQCRRGMSFQGADNATLKSQTTSCKWDGTWDANVSLDTCFCKYMYSVTECLCVCVCMLGSDILFEDCPALLLFIKKNMCTYPTTGTHCDLPPTPPAEKHLEPDWVEDTLIDFDTPINYSCERGMKFRQDFDLASQEAVCRTNNTWDEPGAWLDCIESKSRSRRFQMVLV